MLINLGAVLQSLFENYVGAGGVIGKGILRLRQKK